MHKAAPSATLCQVQLSVSGNCGREPQAAASRQTVEVDGGPEQRSLYDAISRGHDDRRGSARLRAAGRLVTGTVECRTGRTLEGMCPRVGGGQHAQSSAAPTRPSSALQVVRAINPGNIPRLEAIALDGTVLAFTFGLSVLTSLLFGLAPAVGAARVDLSTALKAGGRNAQGEGGLGSSRRRLRSLLVVAEVAISLILLVGAGLLLRSFVRLQHVSPGFDPGGVVSMRLGATVRQHANRDAALAFYRPLSDALAAVPGVTMRGAVSSLPFTSSVGWGSINVEGWTPRPGQELQVDQRSATADYFLTMRIPLGKGR